LLASTLPSSTPHWSKLLMPQMKPCIRSTMLELLYKSRCSQGTAEQQRARTNDNCKLAHDTLSH
jgi:hypothetical protein